MASFVRSVNTGFRWLGSFSCSPSSTCASLRTSCTQPQSVLFSYNLYPFRLKITCGPFDWISSGRKRALKAARRKNLRHVILSASSDHNKDILRDISNVQEQGHEQTKKWNFDKLLVLGEGTCIAAATTTTVILMLHSRAQDSRLVLSSTTELHATSLCPRVCLWQSFWLLAALLINAVLRARQWIDTRDAQRNTEKRVVFDYSMEARLKKLEEEVASAVTIVRVLSKQLEKLGVRFRVTRQTLRDPIQEAALLAEKTSKAVNILQAREAEVEKGLQEIRMALFGMQENQTKQLELISSLAKLVKERQTSKPVKPLSGETRKEIIKGGADVAWKKVSSNCSSFVKAGIVGPQSEAHTDLTESKELDRVMDIGWKSPEQVDY